MVREGEKGSEAPREAHASTLLAAALHTRGLWSPFFAWRRLTPAPFRAGASHWGIDTAYVRRHLNRALGLAICWTAALAAAFVLTGTTASPYWAGAFILLVILQWLVHPWWMARRLVKAASPAAASAERTATVVKRNDESTLTDLGYLLNEAVFSVDTGRPAEQGAVHTSRFLHEEKDGDEEEDPLAPEAFYRDIDAAVRNIDEGRTQRIRVSVHDSADLIASSSSLADLRRKYDRADTGMLGEWLVLQAPHAREGGLATFEVTVRQLTPHVAFHLRQRWLPPLKNRLQKLLLLHEQRAVWRLLLLPALAALLVLLQVALLAMSQDGRLTGYSQLLLDTSWEVRDREWDLRDIDRRTSRLQAERDMLERELASIPDWVRPAPRREREEQLRGEIEAVNDEVGALAAESERLQEELAALRAAPGFVHGLLDTALFPTVLLLAALSFLPAVLFLLLLLLRALRYVRCVVCHWMRVTWDGSSADGVSFGYADGIIRARESLYWSISWLGLVQEVVTNVIIDRLKAQGINTESVRQEFVVFKNEGIYMAGGVLKAANVVAGRRARLFSRNVYKNVRSGRSAVMQNTRAEAKS